MYRLRTAQSDLDHQLLSVESLWEEQHTHSIVEIAMQPLEIAYLTLAALLTGALLPLLFQARATLRSVQQLLNMTAPKLGNTLAEVSSATRDFHGVTVELSKTIQGIRGTLANASSIGNAVGPALVAAVHAFRAIRAEDARPKRTESADADRQPGGTPAN